MRSRLPWVLVILLGTAVIFLLLHRRGLDRQIAALRSEDERLASDLRSVQHADAQLKEKLGKLEKLAAAEKPSARSGSRDTDHASGESIMIHMRDMRRDHPELAALWQRDLRRQVLEKYGDSIAALHLSPAQAEKLKQLLVDRDQSSQDARDAAEKAGMKSASPEMQEAISQATADANQEITALIGAEGNAQLNAGVGARNYSYVVKETSFDMDDAGIPMSVDQSQTVARMMNDAQQHPKVQSPEYFKTDPSTGLSPSGQQFLDQAATLLTSAQLEVLKANRVQNSQKQQVMKTYSAGKTHVVWMMD